MLLYGKYKLRAFIKMYVEFIGPRYVIVFIALNNFLGEVTINKKSLFCSLHKTHLIVTYLLNILKDVLKTKNTPEI